MRVTEQIDALTTLATNPVKYLVVPRLIAAVISLPILVAIADSIGIFGGYVVRRRASASPARSTSRTPPISSPTRTSIPA